MKQLLNTFAFICAVLLSVTLAGCSSEPPKPSLFETTCKRHEGSFKEQRVDPIVTTTISGTVTGTVFTPDGKAVIGTGVGTGVYTGPVTLVLRTCVVDGEIEDLEVVG